MDSWVVSPFGFCDSVIRRSSDAQMWMHFYAPIWHRHICPLSRPWEELTTKSSAGSWGASGLDIRSADPNPAARFPSGPAPPGVGWPRARRPSPGKPQPPAGTFSTSGGKRRCPGRHGAFLHPDGLSPGWVITQHEPYMGQ